MTLREDTCPHSGLRGLINWGEGVQTVSSNLYTPSCQGGPSGWPVYFISRASKEHSRAMGLDK